MKISDALLPEFDQETVNTRKTLERVPMEKYDWAPHAKSMPMGKLATHLATLSEWMTITIDQDSLDLHPPGGAPFTMPVPKTSEELLKFHDDGVAKARASLAAASDEVLMKPWSLLSGGQVLFTMPKVVVIRSFVMNHTVHHRAQLGVYLRLNDIPVPSIYGPSADEGEM
jgi:uncharacterized damage-inducible protein DinB